jgi:uncharacterized protein YyaL (SSP411 family)
MTNRLAQETSPYLLQHADNPVDWYPWGEEALKLAREQDKPILLSIGYSACHWCHVMAHESFEDTDVAAVMNANFINIKVDREERPDIDQIYQTAHGMLSNRSGGWPLTVFLTPQQEPFFSGTYFPKTPRYQLPGFADLVSHVARFYHERKADLAEQNRQLMQAMARTVPSASEQISTGQHTWDMTFQHLRDSFDFEYGGFGSAPKFPNPADISFLLRAAADGNQEAEAMALQMLNSMAAGGIYDHLGGGFCRYSVDARWMIPHFEKMLYDNGQLLGLYAEGWQISKSASFQATIAQTVEWLVREMRSPGGAFYSSLDADSEGEEGKFYVWQRTELQALLTQDELMVANRCWGFDRAANFEDHAWHIYLANTPLDDQEQQLLRQARQKLFAARALRVRPGLDDKLLTSWNALLIKGLAKAGRVLGQSAWVTLAQQAMDDVREKLYVSGHLLATCKGNTAHLNAYLDDHAFLLDAMLELMQCEYRPQDMQFAIQLADTLLEDFQSESGGFYFTGHQHEVLIHRTKQGYDNATPNGNGIAAIALQRLGHLLAESRYLDAAEHTLKAFDTVLQRNPAACPSLLLAWHEFNQPPAMLILRGPEAGRAEWAGRLAAYHLPHVMVFSLDDNQQNIPAMFERPASEKVSAWVCAGTECLPVIDDFGQLLDCL